MFMMHQTFIFSILISIFFYALTGSVVKSQADNENGAELCKGRSPSEYFRLTADCRDVVRCSVQGLLTLRCPSGFAFDIEKRTCDWKSNVKNCGHFEKPRIAARQTCGPNTFACGDGYCIPNEFVCDNYPDCQNGFDEMYC